MLVSLLMLLLINGIGLIGCIIGLPLLLCGLLCLTVKRRAGLWCGWVWFSAVMLYLNLGTGIRWTLIFQTIGYQPEWNYMRLAFAWGMFLVMLLMLVCTLRSFRQAAISRCRRNLLLLLLGWLLWLASPSLMDALLFRPWSELLNQPYPTSIWYSLASYLFSLLRFAALNALAVCSLALRRGQKADCH